MHLVWFPCISCIEFRPPWSDFHPLAWKSASSIPAWCGSGGLAQCLDFDSTSMPMSMAMSMSIVNVNVNIRLKVNSNFVNMNCLGYLKYFTVTKLLSSCRQAVLELSSSSCKAVVIKLSSSGDWRRECMSSPDTETTRQVSQEEGTLCEPSLNFLTSSCVQC